MSEIVIKTIFQFKRGRLEALNRVNPLLEVGEPCYAFDENILKIGNGIDYWNDLPEMSGGNIAYDGKSITITSDKEITLYGFEGATTGQIPSKGEDGLIEWITPAADEAISAEEIAEICI